MGYIVKKPILALSTGITRHPGQHLGDSELPQSTIDQMLKEGVIEEITPKTEKTEDDILMKIRGVDRAVAHGLRALGFHTVEAVANADALALEAIQGVGAKTAAKIVAAAQKMAGANDY